MTLLRVLGPTGTGPRPAVVLETEDLDEAFAAARALPWAYIEDENGEQLFAYHQLGSDPETLN